MSQRYKVFINDSSILFTSESKYSEDFPAFNPEDSASCIDLVEDLAEGRREVVHFSKNPSESLKTFSSQFKILEAAGGWVKNQKGQKLWIHRLGTWDLPKGKIEAEESKELAAVREVEEECGLPAPTLGKALPNSYHMYFLKGRWIFKITYWFHMTTDYTGPLTPQTEEDISEVVWVKPEDEAEKIENTYPSIQEVLREATAP